MAECSEFKDTNITKIITLLQTRRVTKINQWIIDNRIPDMVELVIYQRFPKLMENLSLQKYDRSFDKNVHLEWFAHNRNLIADGAIHQCNGQDYLI